MANRSRIYYREMRAKHIKRKKRINKSYGWYYKCDGMYSKGKIHCSCGICSAKTRNKGYKRRHIPGNYAPNINYKHSDLRKIEAIEQEEKDWENGVLEQDSHDKKV